MHAVVIRAFGPPQVLEFSEVPDLAPGAGEVVVDVEFASVTFVETQVRAGLPPDPRMLPRLPAVLGNGIGGTVVAAGPGDRRRGTAVPCQDAGSSRACRGRAATPNAR